MPGRLVILAAGLAGLAAGLATAQATAQAAAGTALAACRALPDDRSRLACYDALPLSPPLPGETGFQGKGSGMAGPFTISEPRMLGFASDDAILVAYLLDDATGAVIQNLHHGGAGTGYFLIDRPGTYRVQVNASGGWRIDLTAP